MNTKLNDIKRYIYTLPPIDSKIIKKIIDFIHSQEKAVTNVCHDPSSVDINSITDASKLLIKQWGVDNYNKLYSMIISLYPHSFKFFERDLMKFILVVAYYSIFRDNMLFKQIMLLFGFFSFSYNFKTFFRTCNPEILSAAISNSHNKSLYKKHKDFASVIKYISIETIKSYDIENGIKRESWLIFRAIVNINNRIRLSLKNLARKYYEIFNMATKNRTGEYSEELIKSGINIRSLMAGLKVKLPLLVTDDPVVYTSASKVLRIKPQVIMDIYNYWVEIKHNELYKVIYIALEFAIKQANISDELEICSKIYDIEKYVNFLITTKNSELQQYKKYILNFMDNSFEELGYISLKNKLLKDKAAILSFFIKMVLSLYLCKNLKVA